MKRYPKAKIPFPVRPGDTVYRLADGEVTGEVAHGVGVDEDGRLCVSKDKDTFVTIGAEGLLFLTEDDAKAFAQDPASLPDDYGRIDYDALDLPYYPGQEIFFPDYDPFFDRWQLLVSYCTHVVFNEDGSVDVHDDTGGWDTIIGERPRFCTPTFDTARKARNYVRKQGYGTWKS